MLNTRNVTPSEPTVAATIAPRRRELRLLRDPYWPYGPSDGAGSARPVAQESSGDPALMDRLRRLRSVLPAMATEVAMARQEGARLRVENAKLRARLREFDDGGFTMAGLPNEDAMLAATTSERG